MRMTAIAMCDDDVLAMPMLMMIVQAVLALVVNDEDNVVDRCLLMLMLRSVDYMDDDGLRWILVGEDGVVYGDDECDYVYYGFDY